MAWQAIRSFQMGDKLCESSCGHCHRSPEAAAKCGYRNWPSGPAFSEVVRFVGKTAADDCARQEMECRRTDDGQITVVPRQQ